mgnify:FL=1
MRFLSRAALLAAAFIAALLARGSSTGRELIGTGSEYLDLLESGLPEAACDLFTDSLASMISPASLAPLELFGSYGSIRTGGMEERGFRVSVSSPEGGSRTLWLRRDLSGEWRISGDSSLDNVLGSATMICSSFARDSVIPAVSGGSDAGSFRCPVSGYAYRVEAGLLLCPAGHLGEGLAIGGDRCAALRDSLVEVIEDYLSEGYEYPSSFSRMHDESSGLYGRPGGFRCPDHGYSYFEITSDGIFCPYHEQLTPIDVSSDSSDARESGR